MNEHEDLVHNSFPKAAVPIQVPNFREQHWEHGMPGDMRGPNDPKQPVQNKIPKLPEGQQDRNTPSGNEIY